MFHRLAAHGIIFATLLAGLLAGCTTQGTAAVAPGSGPTPNGASGLTYYQDIAPILGDKCVTCHQPGGIAPFTLVSYADAKKEAHGIAAALQSRKMPPLPPQQLGCQPLDDPRNLTDDDRQKVVDWANGPASEGDAAHPAPIPQPIDALGPATLSVDSGSDYTSTQNLSDDYRCFVVDPGLTSTFNLIAAGTTSTNNTIVHHVIVYAQLPAQKAAVDALDANDPGPGYECFGGPGFPGAAGVAASAVGSLPRPFPAGSGAPLPAGTRFVVQVHYNYANGLGSNRFSLQLWRSAVPLTQVPHGLVVGNYTFDIPAGAPDVEVSAMGQFLAAPPAGSATTTRPGLLWSLFPHMHQLGKSIYVELQRTDGSKACLMNIPGTWDFHWQGSYQFAQPVQVNAGDQIKVTCTWDNSAANQPMVAGVQQPPRDVRFGENSTDEMCLTGFTLTDR